MSDLVLVQGMDDTRATLRRWNASPGPIVRAWATGAICVAAAMLTGVLVIATLATPDPTSLWIAGISGPVELDDVASILWRNSLVLALHAFACVAGFIAGASLPLTAARHTGIARWIHEKARPIALAWVVIVTCFSLVAQTYILGSEGSTLSAQLGISPGVLVLTVFPHALPELVALFLPLAAWTLASRRDEWNQLLAATFATTAIAIPILVATASWEAYVWPRLLQLASPIT
ncbi:MAG: hypothetical protein ACR2G3_06000 [Solirubrobacterales bacterium]